MSDTTVAASSDLPPAALLPHSRTMTIFALLMLTIFMAMIDVQVVSTALPAIISDLHGAERIGWITAAYMLAQCATMPIYGKLGDMFGRKPVLLFAVVLFLIGSLACGVAPDINWLIAARVLQGLGGGGVMVSVFSVNADLFEPRERAKYQSFTSLVLMCAASIGPALGGTLTQIWGWRSIFLINLPIGAIVILGLAFLLPRRRKYVRRKIDVAGAVTLTIAIISIVMLADVQQVFEGHALLGAAGLAALALVSLLLWVRFEQRAAEPIIPLSLFQNRSFLLLLLIGAANGAIAIGLVNYHAIYLQLSTGLAPAKAGLFFIAITFGMAIGSLIAGQVISRTGRLRELLLIGMGFASLGLCVLAYLPAGQTSYAVVGAVMMGIGFSNGLVQQSPVIGVQAEAPRKDMGAATGAVTLLRIAGAAVAVSVYGAIVSAHLESAGSPGLEGLRAEVAGGGPGALAAEALVSTTYHMLYLTSAGIALAGLILAILLPRKRLAA